MSLSTMRRFLKTCGPGARQPCKTWLHAYHVDYAAERIVSGNSIEKTVSLNTNDIRMGKIEYVKISSGLIPENLYENGQLELLFGIGMERKISKLPNKLQGVQFKMGIKKKFNVIYWGSTPAKA